MANVLLKKCRWCDGTGTDKEFLLIGGVRGCWDCQATGFEGGLEAQKEYWRIENEKLEELEKELDL